MLKCPLSSYYFIFYCQIFDCVNSLLILRLFECINVVLSPKVLGSPVNNLTDKLLIKKSLQMNASEHTLPKHNFIYHLSQLNPPTSFKQPSLPSLTTKAVRIRINVNRKSSSVLRSGENFVTGRQDNESLLITGCSIRRKLTPRTISFPAGPLGPSRSVLEGGLEISIN